ncbi:MAG: Abi family protein [Lentisphaeria bacterium]|nr:Abi family protein [Lentisphaeria bacterium]
MQLEFYNKPPLSAEQQADLLISRGLQVKCRERLVALLENISYYRLSAYLYPFRIPGQENYRDGTSFDEIYRRYAFDRRLRILIFDALERVETALKARIISVFVKNHGAFGYLEKENFNSFDDDNFEKFLSAIDSEVRRSKEVFVAHYRQKYTNEHLPLWMVAEVVSFGTIFTMYRNMHHQEKKAVASSFDLPVAILESWLHTMNHVRNICAHHARLWNRRLGIIPKRPNGKSFSFWTDFDNEKPFFVLLMLSYLLKFCAPTTNWHKRIEALTKEFECLPLPRIGFVPNWQQHSLWKMTQKKS